MIDEDAVYFDLVALLDLDGTPLGNLRKSRVVQRTVVRIQAEQMRSALDRGISWQDIADALAMPEELVRQRFERLTA